ncbi:growth inhibitor [Synechococcus sp. PCC 7502]|uniref:type II toxin-antitoxin system PemK/MazF family toxin n=1 Tax=Synechococcus sp. PCC 7502 TaxID=1173263 RepID=UPI00029FB766|nr:type II toxin-antitoxin system PemK/MazF family toxin [Synechococcus sp. PCC 7502]AFY72605.1 growth inhibitor [Synechococcus sp. PCC 7502]
MSSYIPERGDILKINFSPQIGSEQAGFRPALVISPSSYNRLSSLAIICPITSKQKGLNFEVLLPEGLQTYGVVLCDQIKSLDWKARGAFLIERISMELMEEVLARIEPLVL